MRGPECWEGVQNVRGLECGGRGRMESGSTRPRIRCPILGMRGWASLARTLYRALSPARPTVTDKTVTDKRRVDRCHAGQHVSFKMATVVKIIICLIPLTSELFYAFF